MCNLCKSQQNRQKRKKKEKKTCKNFNCNINRSEVKRVALNEEKKTGHVTKTEGVADWLICTVHRVTPNCARWAFGFTQKSNNKIKVLMIVLNNNNATISILTSGIDVALTVWGAKMVQDTLINNTVNVWLSHRALLIAFHSFFLSRSTCQNALPSSTRHRRSVWVTET